MTNLEKAKALLLQYGKVNPVFLQRKLNITYEMAKKVVKNLQLD